MCSIEKYIVTHEKIYELIEVKKIIEFGNLSNISNRSMIKIILFLFSTWTSYASLPQERFGRLGCGKIETKEVDKKNIMELEVFCPNLPHRKVTHFHWLVSASFKKYEDYVTDHVEVFISHTTDAWAFKLPFKSFGNESYLFKRKAFICQRYMPVNRSSLRVLLNTRSPTPIPINLQVTPLWNHIWREDPNKLEFHSKILKVGLEEPALIEFSREHLALFKDEYVLITIDQVRGNMCFLAHIHSAGCFDDDNPDSEM